MVKANPGDVPRVIKRYANRKLYDTVSRRFTTLDELARLVESGTRVVVRDHDSGEDRTQDVLSQVLGRRMRSSGGSSADLLASLLKAPTKVASELTGGLPLGGSGGSSEQEKPAKAKKSGKKKPKSDAEKLHQKQQKEIRELRSQVSELTQAVTMLLQEKVEQESKKKKG